MRSNVLRASLVLVAFLCEARAAPLIEGFETWTDTVYGVSDEFHNGAGGTWQSVGCITEISLQRSGAHAYRLTNGLAGAIQPFVDSAYKTGGVGEVSFWFRLANAGSGNYFVSYRTTPGPFSNFPDSAGVIQATNTAYVQWSHTFTNASWQGEQIQIRVARNGTGPSLVIDDFMIGDFAGATSTPPADFVIDDFANQNLNAGLKGVAGQGTAPFIYISERNEDLELIYDQPDGNRDIAWWQGLSFAWVPVDISAYSYVKFDVRGGQGGEDFNFELHYRDLANQTQKPFVRVSEYASITTSVTTVNIPIEDFDDFDKTRAFALALGFRYPTFGQDSMAIDNIALSAYPTAFFQTHSAKSVASNDAQFVLKPHFPQGEGPCSGATLLYEINGGSTSNISMAATGINWSATVSGLTNATPVMYRFAYDCPSAATTKTYNFVHNSVIDLEKPTAPFLLFGFAVSPSEVSLSWQAATDNIGVAGYKVYRNDVEIGTTTSRLYQAMGLSQDTTYNFYVRAFDAAGNISVLSESVNVTTPADTQDPTTPSNVYGVALGPTVVDLSWHAASDDVLVAGYDIFRDGVYQVSTAFTNAMVGGVPGSNHTFTVRAYDDADNTSAFSTGVVVSMPLDAAAPTAPSNLVATPVGPFQIQLTWDASTDDAEIAGYEIFRDGSLVGSAPGTSYLAQGLSPTTTYAFAARAFDVVGKRSPLSETVFGSTLGGSITQMGSYAASVPGGFSTPPSMIYVTTNMSPPLPSSDWWSSILQVRNSGMLPAKPLSFYTKGWAVEHCFPLTEAQLGGSFVDSLFRNELEISATGGSFPAKPGGEARVDGYGDFSVRVRVGNDLSYLTANLVHGSPYAFYEFENCDPVVNCPVGYTLVDVDTNVSYVVVRVQPAHTNHFVIFAPEGTTWDTSSGSQVVPSMPPGEKYLSVAPLTSQSTNYSPIEVTLLQLHAFAFVTNTVAAFAYDRSSATVNATYTAQTKTMQAGQTSTLMGLLPHHWKNSTATPVAGVEYETLLGTLKLLDANSFTMSLRFLGIVPQFPAPSNAAWDPFVFSTLADEIQGVDPSKADTYWHAKDLARIARVLPALDAVGLTALRDQLLSTLETSLIDMLTYTPGEPHSFLAYDATWGTMLGYNESFGSVQYLSDHHFHYGMFVYAAAVVGMYNPTFALTYRGMVERLIRDYNNPSRDTGGSDPLPWLRAFDPWEGHCWASGLGGIPQAPIHSAEQLFPGEKNVTSHEGPDQESTSESMNAWAAMFLWGLATGQDEFIDMGAIGYAIEAEAIKQYWYDADGDNHDPNYARTMASRVFGAKLDPWTWFSAEMDDAWGIQYILTGPHMTYQGYFRDYRVTDYTFFKNNHPGGVNGIDPGWTDIHWMYRCFFEPSTVLGEYTSDVLVNDGNTKANLYYWVHVMNSLGSVDEDVYSDHPAAIAMENGGATNFITYNYIGNTVTANFYRVSDDAPIGSVVVRNQQTTHVNTSEDDDLDGLQNGVEMGLGTDLFKTDSDDDGQNDWAEVFTGVDPLDAMSMFTASYEDLLDPATVDVSWPGKMGRSYDVVGYPSVPDSIAAQHGSNLLNDVAGTGTVIRAVTLPPWPRTYLRVIAR